jgi:hypothetical protein
VYAAASGQSKAARALSLEALEARVLAVARLVMGTPGAPAPAARGKRGAAKK